MYRIASIIPLAIAALIVVSTIGCGEKPVPKKVELQPASTVGTPELPTPRNQKGGGVKEAPNIQSRVKVEQRTSQYFHYALPSGWTAQENANMLGLTAPDNSASIISVGLSGLFQPLSPEQFMNHLLNAQGIQSIVVRTRRAVPPAPGCAEAGVFEIDYVCNGIECRGIASCHVAVGYNQCNGAVTLAAARRDQWQRYANWLPDVASQVGPTGSNTFGAATIAAQSLKNSIALGEKLREVNDYVQESQKNTTNMRWRSDEVINFYRRENLGNAVTHTNPYTGRNFEFPTEFKYYWVNRKGDVFHTNNPKDDPRVGSTEEWVTMPRFQP